MKNLVKNNIRSWKNNKISIIGLSFLTFFGLGSYCVLSNTTANISNQYNKIADEGALHDMTISELYNIGNAHYQTNTKGIVFNKTDDESTWEFEGVDSFWGDKYKVETSKLCSANSDEVEAGTGSEPNTYYLPIPSQIQVGGEKGNYIRTYHITLDSESSTYLYKWFAGQTDAESKALTSVDLVIFEQYTTADSAAALLQNLIAKPVSEWAKSDMKEVAAKNIFKQDFTKFNSLVNEQTTRIMSYMTTENTPLTIELKNNFADDIDFRSFKSANVVIASEFYKVVESDPSDTINKLVLFKDTNNRKGNGLYTTNDFAPYNSKIEFVDQSGNIVPAGTEIKDQTQEKLFLVPSDLSELMAINPYTYATFTNWPSEAQFIYSQIVQIRFKAMMYGDMDRTDTQIKALAEICNVLGAKNIGDKATYFDKFKNDTTFQQNYNDYISDWRNDYAETINIGSDGSITFTWNAPTPKTCKIVNWTTRFAVINPQHLKATNKTVIDPKYVNSFEPYAKWYEATYKKQPQGEIDSEVFNIWLNTLNSNQVNFWIKPDDKHSEMEYTIDATGETITVKKSNWSGIPDEHIIGLNGYNLIVWGCGLTPDFVYPVVDVTRPTPNFKTEAIVYTNPISYRNIKHGYANAPVEKYVVAKFKHNLTSSQKQALLDKINQHIDQTLGQYMLFPQGTKYAALADDLANTLNTSAIRVSTIPSLIGTIRLVTIILSSFIIILCIIICFIIIKRFVEANRVNIGIMRANGFTKKKIALSLVPFSILPSVVGGIGAYVIGFLLQMPALLLFKDYWTLPTSLVGFSALSFIGCIIIPFLLFSAISIIATLVVLKTKAVELMRSGSEFKTNAFSRVVKKPFKKFGIMTRFRVSLAFNSITRLLMLAAVSTLTMSTLVFAMTSYNKLAQSQAINSSQFDYKYSIDLTTPTSSGGTYSTIDISKGGVGLTNVDDYWYNCNWDLSETGHTWTTTENYNSHLTKPYSANQISMLEGFLGTYPYRNTVDTYGALMLPNASDATGQAWDLLYLQNKICSRLTLDYNIGIGSISSNPWEIALSLMPANSRSLAADAFNKIVQNVGKSVATASETFKKVYEETSDYNQAAEAAGKWFYGAGTMITGYRNEFDSFFESKTDPETKETTYTLITDILTVGHLFSAFNIPFLTFLKTIYSSPEVFKDDYTIIYGAIEIDKDETTGKMDEKYTYVNAKIDSLSSKPRVQLDPSAEIKIEGIQWNSSFIKLTDKNNEKLNHYLFEDGEEGTIPVVVNAFAAHKYNLKKGSTIKISATNMVDRYERQMHPEKYKDETEDQKFYQRTLKVQAISQGTNGEAFYISQDNANKLVGMPDGKSWNKTHKYMMYSDDISASWSKDALPKVVDLAADLDKTKNNVWSFEQTSEKPTSEEISKINKIVPVGFNGIYTANPKGKPLTQTLSLYSITGLYPGSSVYKSADPMNNRVIDVLANGNNLALANFITGIDNPEAYQECAKWLAIAEPTEAQTKAYREWINNNFITKLNEVFGDTTMVTAICGAMDIAASDLVYTNLINTLNLTETCIMAIIIPITIIIVGIISNLIITDSKKMAAMLKALGYSDMKNIMSILSLFIPTIAFGLLLAIPLSFGLVTGYQAAIFASANILVDVTQQWWYYAVAIGGIGVILLATYIVGYRSLKKDRLVDQIK